MRQIAFIATEIAATLAAVVLMVGAVLALMDGALAPAAILGLGASASLRLADRAASQIEGR